MSTAKALKKRLVENSKSAPKASLGRHSSVISLFRVFRETTVSKGIFRANKRIEEIAFG
jgi:hypothetical protein